MTGGAISGYWATGRRKNDTAPTITNTTDMTAAKIGRSMKKCEMRIALPQSALCWGALASALAWGEPGMGGGRGLVLRVDFLVRARAHQAVDDDAVIFLQAGLYHPQVVERLSEG